MGSAFLIDFDYSTVLVASAVFLAAVYYVKSRKPKSFPPGPSGLPIIGYMPFLGENGAETMRKMKKKYGSVMSIQVGMEDWVVLNDFKAIHEAFVKQGEKFSGRPQQNVFSLFTDGYGLGMADYGPVWKNLRRFGLTTLRGFGVGKKGMEENVIEEMPYLVENLTTDDNNTVVMKLTQAVSNIICRVAFGSRFTYDDKEFTMMIRTIRAFTLENNPDAKYIGAIMAAPPLRFVPPFKGGLQRLLQKWNVFLDELRRIIAEHEATFDENDHRDFIDAFLSEMKKNGGNDKIFCKKQLLQYIRDLFEAGTGTTSSTLSWMILIFAYRPECQETIAEEIESALGESGVPTMKHREEMPYTCAFIEETMRHKTLVPFGVFHKTNERAIINGLAIPKDTTVIANIWSVHFDPELFENPEEFRPERFLDENGKFKSSKHVIPFSVGPRHCLGEQLAKMELFIFLTGIVQKLKIIPDPEHPLPPMDSGNCIFLGTYEALDYKVKFEKR